jgi:hypothetical protein
MRKRVFCHSVIWQPGIDRLMRDGILTPEGRLAVDEDHYYEAVEDLIRRGEAFRPENRSRTKRVRT